MCPVKVQAYDWTKEVPEDLGAVPFDIILGTDVVYYEHLYAPFIEASWAGSGWCGLHASRGLLPGKKILDAILSFTDDAPQPTTR